MVGGGKLQAPFFSFMLTDETMEKLAPFFLDVHWKFALQSCENCFFVVVFFKYIFLAFSPLMDRTVERERERERERETDRQTGNGRQDRATRCRI